MTSACRIRHTTTRLRIVLAGFAVSVAAVGAWAGTASAEESCLLDSGLADVCTDSYQTTEQLSPYQTRYEDHETATVTVAGSDVVVVDQNCYLETNFAYPITGTEWTVTVAGVSAPTIADGGMIGVPLYTSTEPWYIYRYSPTCGMIAN